MSICRTKPLATRIACRLKRVGLGLLAAIIILAVWTPYETRRAASQWEAAQAIKALGGTVRYNYQFNWGGGSEFEAKPYAPLWLRNVTSQHFLTRAREINLLGANATDDDLRCLPAMNSARELMLAKCKIGDKAMRHVAGMTNLRGLDLSQTEVSGAGMRHLAALTQLDTLLMTRTQVGDEGLAVVGQLSSLIDLRLDATWVTDAGVSYLHGLQNLQRLSLHKVGLTDAAVSDLARLKNLQTLVVTGTEISPQGVRRLQAALPHCYIHA